MARPRKEKDLTVEICGGCGEQIRDPRSWGGHDECDGEDETVKVVPLADYIKTTNRVASLEATNRDLAATLNERLSETETELEHVRGDLISPWRQKLNWKLASRNGAQTKKLVEERFQAILGRAPTEDEMRGFIAIAEKYAADDRLDGFYVGPDVIEKRRKWKPGMNQGMV